MFKNDVILCRQSWHVSWFWHPRDWCKFGWYVLPFDGVVYKSLNIGPLSIHNDWVPVESMETKE